MYQCMEKGLFFEHALTGQKFQRMTYTDMKAQYHIENIINALAPKKFPQTILAHCFISRIINKAVGIHQKTIGKISVNAAIKRCDARMRRSIVLHPERGTIHFNLILMLWK